MRIVCLSAEAADICARIGAWEDVVGVSAFASQAGLPRRPLVGGFSTVDVDPIVRLRPDLVITFSDVQAEISARLIRAGCTVLATNQRSLLEIVATIRLIGRTIGRAPMAEVVATQFQRDLEEFRSHTEPRPRVYFEEWPDPTVSAIGWVGELIELCGGTDVFASRRGPSAKDRTVTLDDVMDAAPDIVLASWCGKAVDVDSIRRRRGWQEIPALKRGALYALDSGDFLQPGPRILAGARELRSLFSSWRTRRAEALAS